MAVTGFGERDLRAGIPQARGNQTMFIPLVALADAGGGTPVMASSGNVANATATATLPATAGVTNFITGFSITFAGATAASVVVATVTGLLGGTMSYVIAVPAGATVGGQPVAVDLAVPHPASAPNTAITLTLPALGAGNTNAAVGIRGFQK